MAAAKVNACAGDLAVFRLGDQYWHSELTCHGPRAAAVVFGFICIALAFCALLAVVMLESRAWRHTMQAESEEWRSLLKEIAHDAGIGFPAM